MLFEAHLGLVKGFKHDIVLKEEAVPVVHKARNVLLSVREQLKDHLDKFCSTRVIEPVDSSEWVSPIVVAKKKNGEMRLCVDLRSLTQNILVGCFSLPKLQEMLAQLGDAEVFCTIDLSAGYH